MRFIRYIILIPILSLFFSCSPKDTGATERLTMARAALSDKDFALAKMHIDSIKILFPKAYDAQRDGLALLDTVRRAENDFIIAQCESDVALLSSKIDSMKTNFAYSINKEYQDVGVYVPKDIWNNGQLTQTTLRPGVKENGELFIESIYIGGQMHDHLKVSVKDGSFAETQTVNDDGFNFRFSNLGKQFEVIRFESNVLNNIADFIDLNKTQPITVTLEGNSKYSYQLLPNVKNAVRKSIDFSKVILLIDSLKQETEKAQFRNFKLDEKKQKTTITEQKE